MTKQEIIPGAKYVNLLCPGTVYIGIGAVDADTLDCISRNLLIEDHPDEAFKGKIVIGPFERNLVFWDRFIKVRG